MVSAESNTLIRIYMYERKKLQKSKYKKRETVYVFKCNSCENELHLRKPDFKKCTGLCRGCSNDKSAKERGYLYRKKPYEALFNIFKRKTIKSGKINDISYEQFVKFTEQNNCFYCYSSVFWTEYNVSENGSSYNLNRKNNTLGYTADNCVVCCWKCNESKKDNFSHEEWYGMTEYFRNKK